MNEGIHLFFDSSHTDESQKVSARAFVDRLRLQIRKMLAFLWTIYIQ